jgi:hypothetical protein
MDFANEPHLKSNNDSNNYRDVLCMALAANKGMESKAPELRYDIDYRLQRTSRPSD